MGVETSHYAQMGGFIQVHGLVVLALEELQKVKNMFQLIRGKGGLMDVGDLAWAQVREVWKGVVDRRWRAEHRELAWKDTKVINGEGKHGIGGVW